MRQDMSRVIVERPRRGGGSARKGRPSAPEDLVACEGMRRPHVLSGGPKSLNENLRPLERFLAKQVGRPWDLVYSEISARLRADNAVQQHVRDHLRDFVAVKPRRLATDLLSRRRGGLWWQPLYVDPDDGILKRTDRLPEERARERVRRERTAPPSDRVPLARDLELRRIEGLWYEVRLAEMPEPVYQARPETRKLPLKRWARSSPVVEIEVSVRRLVSPAVRDVVLGGLVPVGPEVDEPKAWEEYDRVHADRRYAVAKRRLSRTELRRHGIEDRPREV